MSNQQQTKTHFGEKNNILEKKIRCFVFATWAVILFYLSAAPAARDETLRHCAAVGKPPPSSVVISVMCIGYGTSHVPWSHSHKTTLMHPALHHHPSMNLSTGDHRAMLSSREPKQMLTSQNIWIQHPPMVPRRGEVAESCPSKGMREPPVQPDKSQLRIWARQGAGWHTN